MVIQTDAGVTCVRPDSDQVFFMFAGSGLRPVGVHTIDVLARTPLAHCNVVLIRDPAGCGYEGGLGGGYDGVEGIVSWQREQIARFFPHVSEVFCMGVSTGGFAAIQTGCQLGARAAWSMAGRVLYPDVVREKLRVMAELYQRTLGRTRLHQLTAEEEQRLNEACDTPAIRQLQSRMADPSQVIARDRLLAIAADVKAAGTTTDCHLYCVESNAIDRECAEAFRECPNVTIHYLKPERCQLERQMGLSEPDHSIISILNRQREWPAVLAPYVSAPRPGTGGS